VDRRNFENGGHFLAETQYRIIGLSSGNHRNDRDILRDSVDGCGGNRFQGRVNPDAASRVALLGPSVRSANTGIRADRGRALVYSTVWLRHGFGQPPRSSAG
jgi:hypothetical protein